MDSAHVQLRLCDNGPGIVEQHGGTLSVRNHAQGGAEFLLTLPLAGAVDPGLFLSNYSAPNVDQSEFAMK